MKPPIIVVTILVVLVAAAAMFSPRVQPSPRRGGDIGVERLPPAPSDMQAITLVRRPCNGRCPEDSLRIARDGRAWYRGGMYARRTGTFVALVDSDAVFAAIDATQVKRLANLRLAAVTDEPYVTLAIGREHAAPQTVGAVSYHDLPAEAAAAYLVLEGVDADLHWVPADGVAEWMGDYAGAPGTFALRQFAGMGDVRGNASFCGDGAAVFTRVGGALRVSCGKAASLLRHAGGEVEVSGSVLAPGRYQPIAHERMVP